MLLLLAVAACRRGGPDPVASLPSDADALLAVRPVSALSERVRPILDRLPEGEGAADLLRSFAGLDLRDPGRTLDSGLDPDRPAGAAWWRGALLVALPVSDAGLADRRLGLRLARLGFVDAGRDDAGVRRLEDRRTGRRAAVRVSGGVALVCAGPKDACDGLPGPPAAPWTPAAVADELGMADADVVGFARNSLIGPAIVGQAGPARMLGALLGDLRVAVRLDGGVVARAALGAAAAPAGPPDPPPPVPRDVAALVSLAIPAAFGGEALESPILAACGAPCRDTADVRAALKDWAGAAGLVVLADPGAPKAPLVPREIPGRLLLSGAARFRSGAGATAATAAAATFGVQAAAPDGGAVAVAATGRDAASRLGRPDLAAHALSASEPTVLRLIADPARIAEASGGVAVEFLAHVISGIRQVHATAEFRDGRLLLDARVVVR
ncbi:MAG: hypothetical protein FJ087_11880 [Deltaproteobacteria bacterium]|nr:hypothetical protein [Deltaproteobacteria bacterium]